MICLSSKRKAISLFTMYSNLLETLCFVKAKRRMAYGKVRWFDIPQSV